MANPNIVQVQHIYGKVSLDTLGTSLAIVLNNPSNSGKLIKINSILVANTSNNSVDVDCRICRRTGIIKTNHVAKNMSIPEGASLAIVSKEAPLYLPEGYDLEGSATSGNSLDMIIVYEEIS